MYYRTQPIIYFGVSHVATSPQYIASNIRIEFIVKLASTLVTWDQFISTPSRAKATLLKATFSGITPYIRDIWSLSLCSGMEDVNQYSSILRFIYVSIFKCLHVQLSTGTWLEYSTKKGKERLSWQTI